jgi:hypothetical protein
MVTRRPRRRWSLFATFWIPIFGVLAFAPAALSQSQTFKVRPGGWVSTGIHLKKGDSVSIQVSGELHWPGQNWKFGPDGYKIPGNVTGYVATVQVRDGNPIEIGRQGTITADADGELQLAIPRCTRCVTSKGGEIVAFGPSDGQIEGALSFIVTGRIKGATVPSTTVPSAPVPNIAGTWYGRGGAWVYQFTQNGNQFTWVRNPPESASGTITVTGGSVILSANWGTGSGSGRVVAVVNNNVATRIVWENGEVFTRGAASLSVTYEMPRRMGRLHNPPTDADINPKSWPVDFQVQRCAPLDRYEWTVSGTPQTYDRRGPCRFELRFPALGVYPVEVKVTPASGGSPSVGMLRVNVKDWLVVGLGDSLSSGESVPDKPRRGSKSPEEWKDRRCHRSDSSYQAGVARRIEGRSKQVSVTFLHLACSGARIPRGMLGGFEGIEPADPKNPIPAQLLVMKQLIGSRHVDALLLSIGVNDLNFGQVVAFCWKWYNCPDRHWQGVSGPTLRELIPRWLTELWPRYELLDRTLQHLGVRASDVYLLEYPDPLHFRGEICRTGSTGAGINERDAQWLFDNVVLPINAMVARAAATYHWTLVPGAQAGFAPHGYCAVKSDRWITTYNESGAQQNNRNGTLHPNYTGHNWLAGLVFNILSPRL